MIKGINVRESRGEIVLGIKPDQFIATLQELPQKNGWINIILSPNKDANPGGYSHSVRPEKKKQHAK